MGHDTWRGKRRSHIGDKSGGKRLLRQSGVPRCPDLEIQKGDEKGKMDERVHARRG